MKAGLYVCINVIFVAVLVLGDPDQQKDHQDDRTVQHKSGANRFRKFTASFLLG